MTRRVTVAFYTCVVATLGVPALLQAQVERNTKPYTAFKMDVEDTILNATMPFDVKFLLWGDVPPLTTAVALEIKEPGENGDCSAPGPTRQTLNDDRPRKWDADDYGQIDVTPPTDLATRQDVQFLLRVNELDHSREYCFEFGLGREITPTELEAWVVALFPGYQQYLQTRTPAQLTALAAADLGPLRQAFLAAVEPLAKVRIVPKAGSLFDPKTESSEVRNQFNQFTVQVFEQHNIVLTRLQSFNVATTGAANLLSSWAQSPAMAARVGAPANADVAFFRGLTPEQAFRVASGRAPTGAPAPLPTDVWDRDTGFAVVTNVDFPVDRPCPTVGAIGSLCSELERSRERILNVIALAHAVSPVLPAAPRTSQQCAGDIPPPPAAGAPALAAGALRLQDCEVLFAIESQKLNLLSAQDAVNTRANLMERQLRSVEGNILTAFSVMTTTMGSAETQRGWYFGADTGIAVAPVINEVFPYWGVNMNFRPVNTAAPLRGFSSRFATLFGFTWTDNLLKTDQRQALYGESAMLMIGAGFRASRWLRFTGGTLVFQGVDPNPLRRDDTRLELTPFVSMSADIDVARVLGSVFGDDAAPPEGRVLTPQ